MANFIKELTVTQADEGNECNWLVQFELFESETQNFYKLYNEDAILESEMSPWCISFNLLPPAVETYENAEGHDVSICYVSFGGKTYKATVTQKWW